MEKSASLLELMKTRRSVRRFKPDPVPKEYVDMLLEAARWAPSAGNRQPWRFIIVEEASVREKIGELYQKMRKADLEGVPVDSPFYKAVSERVKANFYRNIFAIPPLLIVVCADPKESFHSRTYQMDCAVAIQNMLLMAHALKLGSTYVDFYRPEQETQLKQVRDLLGIPDEIALRAILPLGYPAETPTVPPRKDLHEIVFQEQYRH